jgi:hypothetical protein
LACSLRCDGRCRDVSNPAARHTTVRSPTLCDRGLAAPSWHFQSGAGGADRPVDDPQPYGGPSAIETRPGSERLLATEDCDVWASAPSRSCRTRRSKCRPRVWSLARMPAAGQGLW